MNVLLTTAYWPNLQYMFYVLNSKNVEIEQFENFQKQSYRNRTKILTANGVLDLSIPVRKKSLKELSKDIEISYFENWQIKHWRAIESAYKNSPYFEFFETEIKYFYAQRFSNLLDYNSQQLFSILNLLRLRKNITFTETFEKKIKGDFRDLRTIIHPKIDFKLDQDIQPRLETGYYQTFENKFPFQMNLSILDLLFNKGLETKTYLEM